MISPILSPVLSPPQRPNKSRLRTVSTLDQYSTLHSSINSNSLSDVLSQDSSTSNSSSSLYATSPPEKSRYRLNQLKEDEMLDEIINEFSLPPVTQLRSISRTESLKTSKSLTTMTVTSRQKSAEKDTSLLEPNSTPGGQHPIKLSSSTSTPLQTPLKKPSIPSMSRKYSSNGSILSTTPGHTKHHLTSGSLNRADIIIARLEDWHAFLKSIQGWLEEVSKTNFASSRGYSQRAFSYLDKSNDKGGDEKASQFILTMQAGLHALTLRLAAEQQEITQTIDRKYIPSLVALRKEVKDKIHKLKNDPSLLLDDLLRRAEVTRNKMTILNRCCKQVDETEGQVEMDPWLVNSMVLYHLKREVEEENRLLLLLLPIQKEACDFEQRVIDAAKPAVDYCYQKLGYCNTQESSFQLLMSQMSPLGDWEQFVEMNKRDLVDEKSPTKDHNKINYPNRFHSAVKMLFKGKLQRKQGTRNKQLVEKHYVLTQGGYLHEYTSESHLTPERSYYIPSTTIIPSVDINQLTKDPLFLDEPDIDLTFEVCRPSTSILQKDKVTLFKASTKQDLIDWCCLLIQVSTGIPVIEEPRKNEASKEKSSPHKDIPQQDSPVLEDNESGIIDDYFSKKSL